MCRWLAYLGDPVFLEDFISKPCQSLIAQSRHCREAKSEVNADGFGVGWYGERERPGLFRDVRPAWSDENLLSIAHQIRASLFLAHVRAATGTATIRTNCHPFAVDRYLFMHNGQIGGWQRVRRALESQIPDGYYASRNGTTDSEAIFLLLLALGFSSDAEGAFARVVALIEQHMAARAVNEPFRFTAAISDGKTLFAIRYASDARPPTLYVNARGPDRGALVVSEPIDDASMRWDAVPAQSFLRIDRAGVSVSPFRRA
ncbi:MAG TPA: class II glutamine amidotransferase [Xanthobacteraceae bacterium]|nr:class II glutamine amidotransferase [Xanthobacteraceae bacterium]